MNEIDPSTRKLIMLIEEAIEITKQIKFEKHAALGDWYTKAADNTIETLEGFRTLALNNNLLRISKNQVPKGTGLGLSRGVGEWSSDNELLDSIYKIEKYYKDCY